MIPKGLVKVVPFVGPAAGAVSLGLNLKEIAENATPMGTLKIVAGRLYDQCTPLELWIAGKCVMFFGGVVASVYTGGNPIVVSGALGAFRSIVKKL